MVRSQRDYGVGNPPDRQIGGGGRHTGTSTHDLDPGPRTHRTPLVTKSGLCDKEFLLEMTPAAPSKPQQHPSSRAPSFAVAGAED